MEDYMFQTVYLQAFDLHIVTQPLGDITMLQDDCRFLADPILYQQSYLNSSQLRSKRLSIAPFAKRNFTYNHFWNFYGSIKHQLQQQEPDYWRLQVPFKCRLLKWDLKVILEGAKFEVTVRPEIEVSALGWSTSLKFRLAGEISVEQLTEFVGKLRGKATAGDANILELNGTRLPLWKVFRAVQEEMFGEVYSGQNPPQETRVLDRYIIVCPARFTGPLKSFKDEYASNPMSGEECASFLGMLYGEPVAEERFEQEYSARKFTVVQFHNYLQDFALSEFDKGTLLFMQKTAQAAEKYPRASRRLDCFSSNVGAIVMMIRSLHYFYKCAYVRKYAGTNAVIGPLFKGVTTDLSELCQGYQHDFSKFMFSNFSSLPQDFPSL